MSEKSKNSKRFPAEIFDVTLTRIVDFGNETKEFQLSLDSGKSICFLPGQFVVVLCPQEKKVIRRAYSVASPPSKGTSSPRQAGRIDLVIKLVEGGVVTNWFWSLKEGDSLQVHGPFGKFVLPEPIETDLVFIATGTGIAPFRSMAHQLLKNGLSENITLLFGARYDHQIPYDKEFLQLADAHDNFIYIPTISRPRPEWSGETGYVQTKVEKFFSDPEGKQVYICGLTEMIEAVQENCLAQGFEKDQIFYEKYD